MNATLTLRFDDGTTKEIGLLRAIEIDTTGKQEISFRETPKGWVMSYTKRVKDGRMFALEMLDVRKEGK